MKTPFFATAALLALLSGSFAQESRELPPEVKSTLESLHWQQGKVQLAGGAATLDLAPGFRFLNGDDAAKVLTKVWKNPAQKVLGMFLPDNKGPLDADWAVIVEGFEKEGYVKDSDAGNIDQAKLLKQIQDGQKEANVERKKQGFGELEIVGWAIPPHYDAAAKKLYWGLNLRRVGAEHNSVNYFVRVLGRQGFLVINILGGLEQVDVIQNAAPGILSMIEFNEGQRYADFNPKTDKVAAYGIAGLILGGVGLKVAAKLGLIALFAKKFGVIALALKKLWIVIIAGLAGLWKKVKQAFAGRQQPGQLPEA